MFFLGFFNLFKAKKSDIRDLIFTKFSRYKVKILILMSKKGGQILLTSKSEMGTKMSCI